MKAPSSQSDCVILTFQMISFTAEGAGVREAASVCKQKDGRREHGGKKGEQG